MIKSRVYPELEKISYPVVKEYVYEERRKVVLFTCPGNGFVLHSDFPEEYVGYLRTNWNESTFHLFRGEISIKV